MNEYRIEVEVKAETYHDALERAAIAVKYALKRHMEVMEEENKYGGLCMQCREGGRVASINIYRERRNVTLYRLDSGLEA